MPPSKFLWERPGWGQAVARGALLKCIHQMYPEAVQILQETSEKFVSYMSAKYGSEWEFSVSSKIVDSIYRACFLEDYENFSDSNDRAFIQLFKDKCENWLSITGFAQQLTWLWWMRYAFCFESVINANVEKGFENYNKMLLPMLLSGQGSKILPFSKDDVEPSPPIMPRYLGGGKENYRKSCLKIIDDYILRLDSYKLEISFVRPRIKTQIDRHMRWFILHTKEKWTYERIQDEEQRLNNGNAVELTAIQEAVAGHEGIKKLLDFQLIA